MRAIFIIMDHHSYLISVMQRAAVGVSHEQTCTEALKQAKIPARAVCTQGISEGPFGEFTGYCAIVSVCAVMLWGCLHSRNVSIQVVITFR
jgi:3-polyprenyl-4-hydroxybenzoate decarboxylase